MKPGDLAHVVMSGTLRTEPHINDGMDNSARSLGYFKFGDIAVILKVIPGKPGWGCNWVKVFLSQMCVAGWTSSDAIKVIS